MRDRIVSVGVFVPLAGVAAAALLARFGAESIPVAAVVGIAVAVVLGAILWLSFVICVVRTGALDPGQKAMWVLLLSAFGLITIPLFWFLHLRGAANSKLGPPGGPTSM